MRWKQVLLALGGGAIAYIVIAVRAGEHPRGSRLDLSDPVPAAHAELSGTRLKAKYIAGADGSELFTPEVLHDSQLNVDCAFGTAGDGTMRCIPTVAPDGFYADGHIFYSDPSCTGQLYMWAPPPPAGCAGVPPVYGYTYSGAATACTTDQILTHFFKVGTLVGAPQASYIINNTGACVFGGGAPQNTSFVVYTVDPETPASSFEAGTAGIAP